MTPEQRLIQLRADRTADPMMQILMEIAKTLDELKDEHKDTRSMIEDHMKGEDHLLEVVKSAFPGDDPEGHRRYHEALIEEAVQRKEFWRKLIFELAKYGLLGFVGWALIQLWSGALKGPA